MLKLNLELEKLYEEIEKSKPSTILIQLPDGLKPKAKEIQEKIKTKFTKSQYPNLNITFWAGDCYGACDTPNVKGFDLFVAFGHSEWR